MQEHHIRAGLCDFSTVFARAGIAVAFTLCGLVTAANALGGVIGFQSYSPVLSGGTVADFEGLGEFTHVTTQYSGMTFSQTGGAPWIDNYNESVGQNGCSGAAWCYG